MPKKVRIENVFEFDRRDDHRLEFALSARAHALTAEWVAALRQTYGGQIPTGTADSEILDRYAEKIWTAGLAATKLDPRTDANRRGGRRGKPVEAKAAAPQEPGALAA